METKIKELEDLEISLLRSEDIPEHLLKSIRNVAESLEYWKKRCELAEDVICTWEPDSIINNTWTLWTNFKSSGDVAVFLPRPVAEASKTGIEPEDYEVLQFSSMTIPDPMHDNFRAKHYPLPENAENPCSDEDRERAIKFMDEAILRQDKSKGFTFGYRVHEKEFENELKFRSEKESSFPKYNPKMSFADFAKAFYPDNEISTHHKAIIEKLEEVAGTPNHLIMQGVRPVNWYKSLAAMHETVIKLKEGKKCSVAMFGKGNYVKHMKEFFDVDVELEEICDNIYNIKLIKKDK